jgi:hypothetical protein
MTDIKHVFEACRAKIIAASIQFPMRCRSVGFVKRNRAFNITARIQTRI